MPNFESKSIIVIWRLDIRSYFEGEGLWTEELSKACIFDNKDQAWDCIQKYRIVGAIPVFRETSISPDPKGALLLLVPNFIMFATCF